MSSGPLSSSGSPSREGVTTTRQGSIDWTSSYSRAKLSPRDGESNEQFGASIDASAGGNVILIGGYGAKRDSGAAYVYLRDGGSWVEQDRLIAEDVPSSGEFGKSVALSHDGSIALVGAVGEAEPNGRFSGAVYEFTQNGETWEQESKLVPQDGAKFEGFGKSLDLSADGKTAIIGVQNGKAAYLFERNDGKWDERATLLPTEDENLEHYSKSVAISADSSTILVGDRGDDNVNGPGAGAAYIFAHSGDGWEFDAKIVASDGGKYDNFGKSVDISNDGGAVLVGAPEDDHEKTSAAGSAYVFKESDSGWSQMAKLVANNSDSNDYLGWSTSLAADGAMAMVGAVGDENSDGIITGSGYIFTDSDGEWTQNAKLSPPELDTDDSFGWASELVDQGQAAFLSAVDAVGSNDKDTGVAFVYNQR